MGITSQLSIVGKIIIGFCMFIGRVGPLTIALAITEKQERKSANYRYPEEKIIVEIGSVEDETIWNNRLWKIWK